MRRGNYPRRERGVTTMIEYLIISGILLCLFVVMLLLVNANFMEGPANTITYSAFTDIGNGVSTRIVDTYAIAPAIGNITSHFDIPDEVAEQDYFVEIGNTATDDLTAQTVTVRRGAISSSIGIAGIGSTLKAAGNTTGAGMNRISYDSKGY